MSLPRPKILSYADRLSVAPTERIEFKVSCFEPSGEYTAHIVKLLHGDRNPEGPGFKETSINTEVTGKYPARHQLIDTGSFIRVDGADRLAFEDDFSIHVFIAPTTPNKPNQIILGKWDNVTKTGYALGLGPSGVELVVGDGTGKVSNISTGRPLYNGCWYSVGAIFDAASRQATVFVTPILSSTNSLVSGIVSVTGEAQVTAVLSAQAKKADVPFAVAAAAAAEGFDLHFNGKIERPSLWERALTASETAQLADPSRAIPKTKLAASWDFSAGIGPKGVATDHIVDTGPWGFSGKCVNGPARAMTGMLVGRRL
jgi:N,N-dimethylformamidase